VFTIELPPAPPPDPFAAKEVIALRVLQFSDDFPPLREQAPGYLSARQEKRAEPELMAQPSRAGQIPICDQTPQREGQEESERPPEPCRPPDQRRFDDQNSGKATTLARSRIVA
jgi:hypothetical protein